MSNPHRQSVSGAGTDTALAKIYFGRKPRRAKSSKLLPLPRKLIFLASAPRPGRTEGGRDRAGREELAKQRRDKRGGTSKKDVARQIGDIR